MNLLIGAVTEHEQLTRSLAAEAEIHEAEMAFLTQLHEAQMARSRAQFKEKEEQRKRFHLVSQNVAIDIARRDAIRDAVTYKNSTAQIIMSVGAVMLGSIFAIIYQYSPAEGSSEAWLTLLSAFVTLSVLCLLLSVGFGLLFHRKITGYNSHNILHVYRPCRKAHNTFNEYYHCHCYWSERYAVRGLYFGIGFTCFAAGVYQYLILSDATLNAHITSWDKAGQGGSSGSPTIVGGQQEDAVQHDQRAFVFSSTMRLNNTEAANVNTEADDGNTSQSPLENISTPIISTNTDIPFTNITTPPPTTTSPTGIATTSSASTYPEGQGPAILFMVLCGISVAWLVLARWIVVGVTRAGEQDLIGFTDPQTIRKRVQKLKREAEEKKKASQEEDLGEEGSVDAAQTFGFNAGDHLLADDLKPQRRPSRQGSSERRMGGHFMEREL